MADAVTIHAAKTHLSALVARAEAGEEIVIARGDKPVAKLVPLVPPAVPRESSFGLYRGLIEVGDEALEGWPEEDLAEWYEGHPGDPLRHP
ncbi:type II toxin-antitoxin system Phd/YefM family antitoxin [Paracraurococcus lichenis]|uniref:Antitoxin n=1 Tax=Paracraurococcus lichenis TaxID=3064888 RepID=A0ABT9E3U6_9PROT|nr:type II toxin-antitoxin system prevent-host-death family antitoxin [Paracraurococcus sp. LOR1-02]MDO9710823.1 type II toxin-antitoxin system prevent-host-death family antitoxin [Paracraurococcus sp. LOR1-02]